MKRILILGLALAVMIGALLWVLLLFSASADTQIFARYYPHLVALNVLFVVTLVGLVGWQLNRLWRDAKQRIFGSQLKLRLVAMFGSVAIIPGLLVYAVSVQFITRSIDTWFDVRVETALESGLNLGRAVLDTLQEDLGKKTHNLALELSEKSSDRDRRALIFRFREQLGLQSVSLLTVTGQVIISDQSGLGTLLSDLPTSSQLKQLRQALHINLTEGEGADQLRIRILTLVRSGRLGDDPLVLQVLHLVPSALAKNAEEVQAVYRDYQALQLAHSGLTQIYALTLTLTVLLALFAAFGVAFYLAKRLSAPLYLLTQGTQAVAQGDFSPRLVFSSHDELGGLTESFNQMTRQLDEARQETDRHRGELEEAHAYLESILANLSTGVLVFDHHFLLRTVNRGALAILGDDFIAAIGKHVEEWPLQLAFGAFVRDGFSRMEDDGIWENQFELAAANQKTRSLLARGSHLPQATGGHVVVFDDVSELIAAQRSVAWGEVARRLAHEIKNPLTPIQLSAERMQMRLAERLEPSDAAILTRAMQTIINQVQAMKHMVDDFRDYARMPLPELVALNLNELVGEVLGLYEGSCAQIHVELADNLPLVVGDAAQLRQVVHNLICNAQDALENRADASISIVTLASRNLVNLTIRDNGPGFPPEILPKVFEPYVTTKSKGTGLGLPIVKKIIDEHHAKISILNSPEGGALITLRFPRYGLLPQGAIEGEPHATNSGG